MLLPQFVLSDDGPNDEDVADPQIAPFHYRPERDLSCQDQYGRSPCRPLISLLERPPRR